MALFFRKKQEEQDFSIPMDDRSEETVEEYMQGFRLGFPLVGEPSVTIDNPSGRYFQLGLAAGQAQFKQAGHPAISYYEEE